MAGVPQAALFAELRPALPPGLDYRDGFLTPTEETTLAEAVGALPFAPFDFHGFAGLRRIVNFGFRYDFSAGRAFPADPMPAWLLPVRDRAASWAGLEPEALVQALITEYGPGAPIGWHRDRPIYQDVIGISLLTPCVLRLRRRTGEGWERASAPLAPRSAYILRGDARWVWEHSIAPAKALRYSITFRSRRP